MALCLQAQTIQFEYLMNMITEDIQFNGVIVKKH